MGEKRENYRPSVTRDVCVLVRVYLCECLFEF